MKEHVRGTYNIIKHMGIHSGLNERVSTELTCSFLRTDVLNEACDSETGLRSAEFKLKCVPQPPAFTLSLSTRLLPLPLPEAKPNWNKGLLLYRVCI